MSRHFPEIRRELIQERSVLKKLDENKIKFTYELQSMYSKGLDSFYVRKSVIDIETKQATSVKIIDALELELMGGWISPARKKKEAMS